MEFDSADAFWCYYTGLSFLDQNGGPPALFRGVTNAGHPLVPSIGRNNVQAMTRGDIDELEKKLLHEFQRLTAPILDKPPRSRFEWLFRAQHYGLPTRLLDWSTNPLVALFFATERGEDRDGAIHYVKHAITDQYELFDPSTANLAPENHQGINSLFAIQPEEGTVIFVRPTYTDQRYLNQRSVFSCPQDPFAPLPVPGIEKIIFKGTWKPALREKLRMVGVSSSFIYPGLAGVATEIKMFDHDPVAFGRMQFLTFRGSFTL